MILNDGLGTRDVFATYYVECDGSDEHFAFKRIDIDALRHIFRALCEQRVLRSFRLERLEEPYRQGYCLHGLKVVCNGLDWKLVTLSEVKRMLTEFCTCYGCVLHFVTYNQLLNLKD